MNYFNYFTEIEDAFVRRRGKHLFLSPLDWALMETWKEQGIPLHLVLSGIEKSFDSYEAKPRKRSVKSLFYCQEEVEAQYAEWLEARLGSTAEAGEQTANSETDSTHFSFAAVSEHLQTCNRLLSELAEARRKRGDHDNLSEAVDRALALLSEIESHVAPNESLNTRRLEDSLTGIERMLNDAILLVVESSELDSFESAVKEQLKPYRSQMDPAAYKQTFDNLLLKRLREKFAIPRLSLFYV
jgi:hypothetical protein